MRRRAYGRYRLIEIGQHLAIIGGLQEARLHGDSHTPTTDQLHDLVPARHTTSSQVLLDQQVVISVFLAALVFAGGLRLRCALGTAFAARDIVIARNGSEQVQHRSVSIRRSPWYQ